MYVHENYNCTITNCSTTNQHMHYSVREISEITSNNKDTVRPIHSEGFHCIAVCQYCSCMCNYIAIESYSLYSLWSIGAVY